jgi:hypothetical protein
MQPLDDVATAPRSNRDLAEAKQRRMLYECAAGLAIAADMPLTVTTDRSTEELREFCERVSPLALKAVAQAEKVTGRLTPDSSAAGALGLSSCAPVAPDARPARADCVAWI